MLKFTLLTLASVGVLTAGGRAADVPVTFTGGHDIGPKDHGRPCVLIAAALGVKPEVFREAFGGVTPAKGRGPSGDEARRNKDALLKVLAPHGVTNDRLDEVSNFYRYRPQTGELWRHTPAVAHAVVENGVVTRVVVTAAGAGYSTPPTATVKDMPGVTLTVTLLLDKDLKKNGGLRSITVSPPAAAGTPPAAGGPPAGRR